eukprot:5343895-Pyramimonas_sp.AAC.1
MVHLTAATPDWSGLTVRALASRTFLCARWARPGPPPLLLHLSLLEDTPLCAKPYVPPGCLYIAQNPRNLKRAARPARPYAPPGCLYTCAASSLGLLLAVVLITWPELEADAATR